ncbi:hypothetical protein FOL46_008500 [Perkinsus olseni]|uniref:Uncharacterized protein n=1 Tax=Perkinsus olseni TaxID=32597 RepID=A0A7J6L6M0_PEROL|nr:hypothetical protein FOL46_008500 [Perkinsus olseni]
MWPPSLLFSVAFAVISGGGLPLKLPAGIYTNQGPIEGIGRLKGIQFHARDDEQGEHSEVKLRLAGSLDDYDLVFSMVDYCTVKAAITDWESSNRDSISRGRCLTFRPTSGTQADRLSNAITVIYRALRMPTDWTVYMGKEKSCEGCKGKTRLVHPVPLKRLNSSSLGGGDPMFRPALLNDTAVEAAQSTVIFRRDPVLTRIILPRTGKLVNTFDTSELDGIVLDITGSPDGLQGTLMVYRVSGEPIEQIITGPHVTYNDDIPPFYSATLELPPLPLLYGVNDCWRLRGTDDDDKSVRDFVIAAVLVLGFGDMGAEDIRLCFANWEWKLHLGSTSTVMVYERASPAKRKRSLSQHDEGSPTKRFQAP